MVAAAAGGHLHLADDLSPSSTTSPHLRPQVAIFIFMDAMTHPAPLLRITFALVLLSRFLFSFVDRTLHVLPNEQAPWLPQVPRQWHID